LVDVFGPKLPLVTGPVIAAIGFALFTRPAIDSSYWTSFFPAICILGLGMSITVAPLTTTVMNAFGTELAGTASGINNAVSRVAALLAIALFGVVLTQTFNARLSEGLVSLQAPADLVSSVMAQKQKLAGIVVPEGYPVAIVDGVRRVIGLSFVAGFRWVMLICAALALLSAVSAWMFIQGEMRWHPIKRAGRASKGRD
jgi:hypothetical protein